MDLRLCRGTSAVAILLSLPCCSPNGGGPPPGVKGAGSVSPGGSGGDESPVLVPPIIADAPAPAGCGNGVLGDDEACDDGNRAGGEGCLGNCLAIEPGFACPHPGTPCRPIARCGDGFVSPSEACDDGNTAEGDGCSDGIVQEGEYCDDGNRRDGDGCSSSCRKVVLR